MAGNEIGQATNIVRKNGCLGDVLRQALSVGDQNLFNFELSFTVDSFMSVVVHIAFGPISVWLVSRASCIYLDGEIQDGGVRT